MKRKNAFTLIELLAVIVILAIIALIATPIILGIVEDARKDSFMRSVELVINATDIDIFGKNFNNTYTYTINDGNISNLEVGVKNTDGMNGSITYDTKGNDTYAIHNGKYCVIKTSSMDKAEIKDYVEGECELAIPTDAKYFTYKYFKVENVKIVDKDACMEYMMEGTGAPDFIATSLCNNETYNWGDEGSLTLPEFLEAGYNSDWTLGLKEAGAIEFITKEIEITGYSEEGPKGVIIPEEIDGYKVGSIGSFAFSNMSLTSVELPQTLTNISSVSFMGNLFTNITLPENLETIGDFAFCYNDLDETSVSNIEEINEYAYCTITGESYFTYEEMNVVDYEIIDVDACVASIINDWDYDEDVAISLCNNGRYSGSTLTGILTFSAPQENINALKEAGAIEEVRTSLGVKITGYSSEGPKDVVIPETIDGKDVVAVGARALENLNLTSAVVPYSVGHIGSSAFQGNSSFNKFGLGNNSINFEVYVFCGTEFRTLTDDEVYKRIYEINPSAFSCMTT